MEHRPPQDRFQAAVHGQARPRFRCVARPFVRPLIRPGRWSGLGFQADFRRRATEHGHGKRRFLRPAQARPDVQLRALSPGREPGVQIGPQGLRCGSRSRRVSSFPLRRLCFCRVRRWRRRRAAQQFRRQQGVFHAQRVQMHRGQPTGQVIQNARRVAEHHAQALHGQGRLRDGRLRGGRQIGQTTQCRIDAADGRNTHSAGQGMPVPGKAVFRSRKPDALGVGGFQAEGAGKGQRAGEVGQAHMQAAFPQGAFQSGIDGFCHPLRSTQATPPSAANSSTSKTANARRSQRVHLLGCLGRPLCPSCTAAEDCGVGLAGRSSFIRAIRKTALC